MSISRGSYGFYFTKLLLIFVISSEAINISLSVQIPEGSGSENKTFEYFGQKGEKMKLKRQSDDSDLNASDFEDLSCDVDSIEVLLDSLRSLMEDPEKVISAPEYICTVLTLLKRTQENYAEIIDVKSTIKENNLQIQSMNKSMESQSTQLNKLETAQSLTASNASSNFSSLQNQFNHFTEDAMIRVEKQTESLFLISNNVYEINLIKEQLNETMTTVESQAVALQAAMSTFNLKGEKWNEMLNQITSAITELGTRSSQSELEIVEKLSSIIKDLRNLETQLESSLKNETARATQEELVLHSQIENESQKVLESLSQFSIQLAGNLKTIRSEQIDNHYYNLSSKMDQKIDEVHSKINKIHLEVSQKIENNAESSNKSSSEMTKEVQHLVQTQFKLLESLESELKSKLEQEMLRATKVELELLETIQNETSVSRKAEIELKSILKEEVNRAELAVNNLLKEFSQHDEKIKNLEEDFESQLKFESMRAKSTEAQLSSIIIAESERAKESEAKLSSNLNSTVITLRGELQLESYLAQELTTLEKKLSEEIERAASIETNLLGNINEELKRASEKEEILHQMVLNDSKELEKLKERLNSEVETSVNKSATALESKVIGYLMKIEEIEEKLQSGLDGEITRAQSAEIGMRELIEESVKRATRFEVDVLTTIMSNVERLGEFEKEMNDKLTTEIERAQKVETNLFQYQVGNWSNFDTKFENAFSLINNDTMTQVVDKIGEVKTKLDERIDSMSEEVEKKVANLIVTGDKKLKKMEDDLKKCCSSSGWFRRPTFTSSSNPIASSGGSVAPSPSSNGGGGGGGGGVFDRVMGLFGRRRVNNNATKSSGSKTAKSSLIFSNKDNESEKNASTIEGKKESRIDDEVFKGESRIAEIDEDEINGGILRLNEKNNDDDDGAQIVGENELKVNPRSLPVLVHRSNSKVRNIYG